MCVWKETKWQNFEIKYKKIAFKKKNEKKMLPYFFGLKYRKKKNIFDEKHCGGKKFIKC